MPESLTDDQIAALIAEPKPLPGTLGQPVLPLRGTKMGHREAEYDVQGSAGHDFRIIVRQSECNPLDFSVVLAYRFETSNRVFRLRRYNGKSHQHTNRIEGLSFYDYHIHMATERYQRGAEKEDAYAEPTNRYGDLYGAIACLIADCGFQASGEHQPRLL